MPFSDVSSLGAIAVYRGWYHCHRAPVREVPPLRQSGAGNAYYPNCASARAVGAAPIRVGEPGYRAGLDRDRDGVACE